MQKRNGITYRKFHGISAQGMRLWGLAFLLLGAVGYGVFGNALVPSYGVDANGVSLAPMSMLTVGSILQIAYYCAIPIFCFLLVEGMKRTSNARNYAIRVAILAVATELPYNLCMTGKLLGAVSFEGGMHFDMASFSLNPVFGSLLCLVVLLFFRHYAGKSAKNIFIKVFIWLVAFLWVSMLRIDDANRMLVIVPVLWIFRKKKGLQILFGCVATLLSCIFNMDTMAFIGCCLAPLTMMLVHFYNEEPGESNRIINYAAYPVILLAAALLAKFAI